jgi:hypothetical protein
VILCGVLLVLFGGWADEEAPNRHHHRHHSKAGISADIDIDDGFADIDIDDDVEDPFDVPAKKTKIALESLAMSPMEDMGMLGIERNSDALPSSVWGNHLTRAGHPLPTNSWYLVRVCVRCFVAFFLFCVEFGFLGCSFCVGCELVYGFGCGLGFQEQARSHTFPFRSVSFRASLNCSTRLRKKNTIHSTTISRISKKNPVFHDLYCVSLLSVGGY